MTTPAPGADTPADRRRRGRLALAVLALVLGAAGGWWVWREATTPAPPALNLDNMEPDVAAAIGEAVRQVRRDGRSGAAWGHLGMVLQAHDLSPQAHPCFLQAVRFDPNEPRWSYLAAFQLLAEDPERAVTYLRRAVELADRQGRFLDTARLLLAETLLRLDRLDEAGGQLDRVLRVDPGNPRAHYGLGLLAAARNDLAAAVEHLAQAAGSPECRQKACAQLARVYQQQGDEAAAAEFSRRSTQPPADLAWNDPYAAEYARLTRGQQRRFQEAEQLQNQGALRPALQMMRDLSREFPGSRSSLALGLTLTVMGDYPAAEVQFRQALGQDRERLQARFSLGMVLYLQGLARWDTPGQREPARQQLREAVTLLREVGQRKPDHALAHLYHGLALRLLGQRQEAVRLFRLAVECRPEMMEGHLYLGEALAEEGQLAEARQALEQAVLLAPPGDNRARETLERTRKKG